MTTTTENLAAFHGKVSVKKKFLKRVREHQANDKLVQGYGYWSDGKGCAVGCTLERNEGDDESGVHGLYPEQLGLPTWLAHLEDHIFEALPKEKAQQWPERFLAAIKTGQSIPDAVRDQFQVWWLDQNLAELDAEKAGDRNADAFHLSGDIGERHKERADHRRHPGEGIAAGLLINSLRLWGTRPDAHSRGNALKRHCPQWRRDGHGRTYCRRCLPPSGHLHSCSALF